MQDKLFIKKNYPTFKPVCTLIHLSEKFFKLFFIYNDPLSVFYGMNSDLPAKLKKTDIFCCAVTDTNL
ncbi:MAG: hypothetical protein BWK80_31745 [Desulfobacteraceae bacterium IS3]|nr:MAG: hypothetical protein BWK80_31745 [Desulfobacteraceae bacterium IS3]